MISTERVKTIGSDRHVGYPTAWKASPNGSALRLIFEGLDHTKTQIRNFLPRSVDHWRFFLNRNYGFGKNNQVRVVFYDNPLQAVMVLLEPEDISQILKQLGQN